MLDKKVPEELALVLASTVELATVYRDEVRVERKVVDDAPGVHERLRRGHVEARSAPPEKGKHLADTVVGAILKEADLCEAFAIEGQRTLHDVTRLRAHQLRERGAQRRPDREGQGVERRRLYPEALERVGDGARDAFARIGEGAIE